jgi:hypothetical protein
MSWPTWLPGFSALWGAWLFLLLIPLIIFYFLKLKRPRLEIASLALWRQVINDQRVNSPFQRFKRNLLLLLQIIVLSLIALATMQPFLQGSAERAQYLPILIDCSASMAAVDESSGKSRLDLAKEQVREIIEGLLPGQQITLIAVDSTARRLTEFTDNQPVLLAALNSITTTDVPSRLDDGLQLAQALTRTFRIDKVRLYSDGNLPTRPDPSGKPMAVVDFDLSFDLDFHQIPGAGANLGITALNTRRAAVDRWDVFVRVEGCADATTLGKVQLLANGEPLGEAESVNLGKGESQRLVFSVDAREPAFLEARLAPEGHDALAADNAAFLDLPVGRELLLYCAPGLATFRHSLGALEGLLIEPDDQGATNASSYDLVISDQADDLAREATTYLLVGLVPEELESLVSVELSLAEVVDWKRDEPLLQHVQMKEVQITDLPRRQAGVLDGDFEKLGYELLAFGNEGPLIVRKRDGPKLYYWMLFHTDRSTLPYRVGFPILVQNIVNLALQQSSLSELRAVTTGVLPAVENLKPAAVCAVTGPGGLSFNQAVDDQGTLDGVPAHTVGRYEIRQGGKLLKRFGAGLLNSTETSLYSVKDIQFRELKVSASEEQLKMDKPLWPKLAAAAFAFLLLEWWFFQKKPAGMPS